MVKSTQEKITSKFKWLKFLVQTTFHGMAVAIDRITEGAGAAAALGA
jgi:hypothetical protein